MELLAFTDGSDLSQNEDVSPYAERAVGGAPTANNAITTRSYQGYTLTVVDINPSGNRLAYYASGDFTVGAGEAGDWYVGAQVNGGKPASVASLTCFRAPEQ